MAELAAADESGHRYELVDGTLLVVPPADFDHAETITRLTVWFVTNGYGTHQVLATPGIQITERTSGRVPDLIILRRRRDGRTVWADPADVALVVEVVSPGSERVDREAKPGEYARAGITQFWRIERGDNAEATVHQFRLGNDLRGEPTYLGHRAVLLEDLLASKPPELL
ncbi:Uma2 family endonuclease [Phytohabitans flavus]|uniref:Uma2 family endonuclease n=1 Tax=Phytohabitans flavus TaxID=1076124 RepID=UPI001E37B5C1|nr:Uma2 family endonuclease [Phytohabitans flavus]